MIDFEYVKDILKRNILSISCVAFGVVSLFFSVYIYTLSEKRHEEEAQKDTIALTEQEEPANKVVDEKTKFRVDVKGAVKNPGVYEFEEIVTVNDAIKSAGGLNSKGTTANINLSKKIKDEMVIYVFTKSELEKKETAKEVVCEIPKCECETVVVDTCIKENETNVNTVKKISINNGSLEELMGLNGIGEAKAKAIIQYRNEVGPFMKLEDITKVSGISETIYEKIKDNIEL